jgi:hypothetical protein
MSRPLVALIVLLATAPPASAAAADAAPAGRLAPGSLQRLSWLAGCWARGSGDSRDDEQWLAPLGGAMLGVSRTVRDGRAVAWEQMRIEERDSTLVFTARPSGQTEASFEAIALTDSSVTFENPAHDFPQRVSYTLRPDGGVLGAIEGVRGGRPRRVEFPLARAACAGGAAGR